MRPHIKKCKVGGCVRSARADDFYYCAKHGEWLSPNHREHYRILHEEISRRLSGNVRQSS